MNKESKRLDLRDSEFNNAHGLEDKKNTSSALDMGRLSWIGFEGALFRQVVGTCSHRAEYLDTNGHLQAQQWHNTNRLLYQPGW